jgi:hypothetical protein
MQAFVEPLTRHSSGSVQADNPSTSGSGPPRKISDSTCNSVASSLPGRGGGCRLCSPANASALCAPPHHAMHDVPCPPAAPTVPGSCHRAHWRSHTSVLQVHRPALVALNGAIIGRQIIPDRQPSSSHCILQPTMQVRRSQNHITPRRISSLTSHRSSSAVSLSLILRCPVIFRNGLNPTASLILHGGLLTHLSAARTSRQCVRQSPRKADTQGCD